MPGILKAMSKPVSGFPALRANKVLRILRRIGYVQVRQAGSHIRLEAEGRRPIVLSTHAGKGVPPRHLRDMLVNKAGLSDGEIDALLSR